MVPNKRVQWIFPILPNTYNQHAYNIHVHNNPYVHNEHSYNIHVHNNPYVHNHHAYNIHVHNNPIVHNQHVWIINIFYKIVFGIYKKFEKFALALRAEATLYIGRVAFLISSCIMENFPWNMPVYVHAY